jgi:hypothetical protein
MNLINDWWIEYTFSFPLITQICADQSERICVNLRNLREKLQF